MEFSRVVFRCYSMISNIIVWDDNRPRAFEKLKTTLKDTIIFGVKTNIDFLLEMISHFEFVNGEMNTSFIGQYYKDGLKENKNAKLAEKVAIEINQKLSDESLGFKNKTGENPWTQNW